MIRRCLTLTGIASTLAICAVPPPGYAAGPDTLVSGATGHQVASTGGGSTDDIWAATTDQSIPAAKRRHDLIAPYALVRLNKSALDRQLGRVPREDAVGQSTQQIVITLPLPDGRFGRFSIAASSMLAPELAAAFPGTKTYRGQGLDDRTATASIDWTDEGFHAMVIAAGRTVYIEPYVAGDFVTYISYDKADRAGDPSRRSQEPR